MSDLVEVGRYSSPKTFNFRHQLKQHRLPPFRWSAHALGRQDADDLAFGEAVLGSELAGCLGTAVVGGDAGVAHGQEAFSALGSWKCSRPP